jgi:hypothetical protein
MNKAFKLIKIVALSAALCSSANAQSISERVEACNAIGSSKKRLDCLKVATSNSQKISNEADRQSNFENIGVAESSSICSRLFNTLQSRNVHVEEAPSKSSETDFSITWIPVENKPPIFCSVNRSTRKISSIEIGGLKISGPRLVEMGSVAQTREQTA